MAYSIYVGNLSPRVSESELKDLFARYGDIKGIKLITDAHTGRSKGFGFVEMEKKEAGQQAIQGLNGIKLQGQTLRVNEAYHRKQQKNQGTGRRRGFGRYGSRDNRRRRSSY
ncbi:MAG: RNA-binding protein [Deltaproteobacteria bacterium]|nr:RNA-binding protein [Deltaproteobacteria bacterium]MBW1960879.1 RNA-binding protein [Deltaproteobacteria bacterium]MBW1995796.1 RNA-binding protein [Deltaproteobacteria bacterium]MBW2152554.1 RNA-binding protein [Deltaproteobacteria bacterium]